MNVNTRLRLWKEVRALLPMWAAAAAWMIAPFLLPVNDPLGYAVAGFLFGCVVLGPVCVGHEFTHRTMGVLLAQPVPRRQLWREKLLVTGVALTCLSLLLVLLIQISNGWNEVFQRAAEDDPFRVALFIAVPLLLPMMAFCTGPALTLVTRNALGGAAATFIYPFFLLIGGLLIVASMGEMPTALEEQFFLSYVLLIGGIYSGGVFLFGCRRFGRLEDANLLAQELAPPRQLSALFACLTRHTAPGRHGATANLLRKELRLQQPAFLVAAFLVALWVTFIGVWKVHPPVGAEMLIVPSILLALGIPVTVGIVSTAEERNLGVHEWHLTLPVSARRQWCVKVLVALGVNAVLGLVLPGLLAHASSWLANDPQLVAEIPGRKLPAFLIANGVIICAGIYASTAAANAIRALVGTIGLLVAAGVTIAGVDRVINSLPEDFLVPQPDRTGWWPSPEVLEVMFQLALWLGWTLLVVWLLVLGLARFRRGLESGWRPWLRLVPFFLTGATFIGCVVIYGMLVGHYHWTYYDYPSSHAWERRQRAKQRLELTPHPQPNPTPSKPRD